MIIDNQKNLEFYTKLGIGDRYAKAIHFLKNTNLKELAVGRHEISGEEVYANVAEYNTLPWEESTYELHRAYADIQYVISGEEIMTFAPAQQLEPKGPFDETKDVILFHNSQPGTRVVVGEGDYILFRIGEVHKSKTMVKGSVPLKKIVVKIKEI